MQREPTIELVTVVLQGMLAWPALAGVVIQPDEPASQDVFNYQFLPTFNFETSGSGFQAALATCKTSTGHDTHSLIAFDLSSVSIPSEDVTSATLNLYVADAGPTFGGAFANPSPGAPVDVDVLTVSGPWDESTVTWNSEPAPIGGVLDTATIAGIDQWITLDVTDPVRDWLAGTEANNGFILRQPAEVNGPGGLVAAVYDSSSGPNKPYLAIVPEPGTFALMLVAGAALGRQRR